jgi:CRISPR system Cascade subunit CasE
MIHVTRVIVSFELARSLRIRDSYDWHQRVWEMFPCRDGERRNFLTRLDEKPEGFELLVLSPSLPTRPPWCAVAYWQVKDIAPQYFRRSRYAFRLRANPTRKVVDPRKPRVVRPDGKIDRNRNARRVALTEPDALRAWLARKAEAGGFLIEQARIKPFGKVFFRKPGAFAPHFAVDFDGVLNVTDPQKFYEAFCRGIGSAKAFGFGLLAVVPISTS